MPPPKGTFCLGPPLSVLPRVLPQRLTWGSGVSWALLTLAGPCTVRMGERGTRAACHWEAPHVGGRFPGRAPGPEVVRAMPRPLPDMQLRGPCAWVSAPQPAHSCPADCCPRAGWFQSQKSLPFLPYDSGGQSPNQGVGATRSSLGSHRAPGLCAVPWLPGGSWPVDGPRLRSVPWRSQGLVPVCPRLLLPVIGLGPRAAPAMSISSCPFPQSCLQSCSLCRRSHSQVAGNDCLEVT